MIVTYDSKEIITAVRESYEADKLYSEDFLRIILLRKSISILAAEIREIEENRSIGQDQYSFDDILDALMQYVVSQGSYSITIENLVAALKTYTSET